MQLDLLAPPTVDHPSIVFSSKPIPDSVLSILKHQITIKAVEKGFAVDAPEMERKTYEGFIKVVQALRGDWNGKTHLFPYNPTVFLDEVCKAGRFPESNPYSLFQTPESAIDDLFVVCDLPQASEWYSPEFRILEPSAGRGAIARKLRDRLPDSAIDCVEIDPYNREMLKAQGFNLIADDFLNMPNTGIEYDYILMNPPFNGTEYIDHVLKAHSMLRVGGAIGAIIPDSVLWQSSKKVKEFRNFVAEHNGYWEACDAKFEGTPVKTLLVKINKPDEAELTKRWEPNSGYSSTHHLNIEVALDSDRAWHDIKINALKLPEERRSGFISDELDRAVARLTKDEYCCFLYSDRVKNELIKSCLEDLQDYE